MSSQGKLWHILAELEIDCKHFAMVELLLCIIDSDKYFSATPKVKVRNL